MGLALFGSANNVKTNIYYRGKRLLPHPANIHCIL